MKLSILILTHNRPALFKRAINSVLNNLPQYDIEIVVNNDTNDIYEIYDDRVSIGYFYLKDDDLSSIYKSLFAHAKGEYIFFLEDDDYIQSNFFTDITFEHDVYYLDYTSHPLIEELGLTAQYNRITRANRHLINETKLPLFRLSCNLRDFQLSRIIFKKCIVQSFPSGNRITNDVNLFKSLNGDTIRYMRGARWIQTTDGNDNISFDELNKDERFC